MNTDFGRLIGLGLRRWPCIPKHISPCIVCKDITDKRVSLVQIEYLILLANAIGRPGFYDLVGQKGVEIPVGLVEEDSEAIYEFIIKGEKG